VFFELQLPPSFSFLQQLAQLALSFEREQQLELEQRQRLFEKSSLALE